MSGLSVMVFSGCARPPGPRNRPHQAARRGEGGRQVIPHPRRTRTTTTAPAKEAVRSCKAYAKQADIMNRRWLFPLSRSNVIFWLGTFNDLLLIPNALPRLLWIQKLIGVRHDDGFPTGFEVLISETKKQRTGSRAQQHEQPRGCRRKPQQGENNHREGKPGGVSDRNGPRWGRKTRRGGGPRRRRWCPSGRLGRISCGGVVPNRGALREQEAMRGGK